MDLQIKGRTAIISGSSRGIGFAIAEELVANGVSVVLVARGAKPLEEAKSELQSRNQAQVESFAIDITARDAADKIVSFALKKFGSIGILVNNAGRAHAGGVMSSTEEDWEGMTALKLSSMRRMCKAVIPIMQANGWGRIINMSSIGGIYPNPKLLISHVLSAAINNLTKSLALEVAKDGILVNAIGVGAVATENWAHNMLPAVRASRPELAHLSDDELLSQVSLELTPIGRPGKPEEIASIAAYLCSNRNGFVTGDTIEASGGADRFM
ncbi:SDR family NAD(P)-dependent oxidoreductase [Flexibacterium corallicola]|uniref:SDR family NAD(P)-dependent oxidoreductase n=1 Tax=Flexibacterium corallicola TaxID=3037259 RepID=UPI00286F2C0D|nr:SDR family oxidoreductase [Pseudovibrio sp. M1P-2-3]